METQNAQKAFNFSQEYDGCTIIRKEDVFASCLSAILWKEQQIITWLKDNLPNWVDSYKEDKIIEDLENFMKRRIDYENK